MHNSKDSMLYKFLSLIWQLADPYTLFFQYKKIMEITYVFQKGYDDKF